MDQLIDYTTKCKDAREAIELAWLWMVSYHNLSYPQLKEVSWKQREPYFFTSKGLPYEFPKTSHPLKDEFIELVRKFAPKKQAIPMIFSEKRKTYISAQTISRTISNQSKRVFGKNITMKDWSNNNIFYEKNNISEESLELIEAYLQQLTTIEEFEDINITPIKNSLIRIHKYIPGFQLADEKTIPTPKKLVEKWLKYGVPKSTGEYDIRQLGNFMYHKYKNKEFHKINRVWESHADEDAEIATTSRRKRTRETPELEPDDYVKGLKKCMKELHQIASESRPRWFPGAWCQQFIWALTATEAVRQIVIEKTYIVTEEPDDDDEEDEPTPTPPPSTASYKPRTIEKTYPNKLVIYNTTPPYVEYHIAKDKSQSNRIFKLSYAPLVHFLHTYRPPVGLALPICHNMASTYNKPEYARKNFVSRILSKKSPHYIGVNFTTNDFRHFKTTFAEDQEEEAYRQGHTVGTAMAEYMDIKKDALVPPPAPAPHSLSQITITDPTSKLSITTDISTFSIDRTHLTVTLPSFSILSKLIPTGE